MKSALRIGLWVSLGIVIFSNWLKKIAFGLPVIHIGNLLIFVIFMVSVLDMIIKKNGKLFEGITKKQLIIIGLPVLFLICGSISTLIYEVRPLLYFWSLRNYLRFFILFYDCIILINEKMLSQLYKAFNVVFFINFFIMLIQFFFFDIKWDYLNGVFGYEMGGNSGINALFIVNTALVFYMFYKRKVNYLIFVLNIVIMCLCSALSELKVYYVELFITIIAYVFLTREFKRILKSSVPLTVVIIISEVIFHHLYPYFEGMIAVELIKQLTVPHHDNFDSLSRFNQVSGLITPLIDYAKSIRPELGSLSLFTGCGFGSAEYGTVEIFNSDFYYANQRLWYFDFLQSFLFIENGIVGIAIYDGFLSISAIYYFVIAIKTKCQRGLFGLFLFIMILCVSIYDCTLRNNYGYIIWAAMGIALIIDKKEKALCEDF